jgi:hypothetical protein
MSLVERGMSRPLTDNNILDSVDEFTCELIAIEPNFRKLHGLLNLILVHLIMISD